MLSVSNAIKNAYNQYTTQRKSYIKVGNNTYFIQNMYLYADAYYDGNVVGNAIAKILKFDIETEYVSGLDEFELYDGIWTGSQYEYINLGTFKLFEELGKDDYFTSITAYDKLVLFNEVYQPDAYPTTIYGLLQNICSQAGVTLATQSIANGDKVLANNLFVENETLKDILRAICQISGTFAVISNDELHLKLVGTDTLTLQKYQLNQPEYKRTTWNVNQVVLGMQDIEGEYVMKQDDDDVEHNGVHRIVINNNPFVYTQELRQEYIDDLFDAIYGFGYIAFDTKWEGLPYVELGDQLVIDGRNSIVLRYEISSPNGLSSTLSAPSIIDSVVNYIDNTNDLNNRMKKTEYTVDKANGTITELTRDVQNINDSVGNMYSKTEVNELVQSASQGLVNTFTISGGNNLLRNTAPYFMTSSNEAEYWEGNVKQVTEQSSTSGYALGIQSGILKQSVNLVNGIYSLSFKYKRNNSASTCQVRYNGRSIDLDQSSGSIHTSGEITTGQMIIEIEANASDNYEIYDLILKHGNEGEENMLVWTQNANESISDTIQISNGITALSNATDTKATMDSQGFIVRNKTTNVPVMEATRSGGRFLDLTSTGKSNISGLIIEKHDHQIWGTGG